VSIAPFEAKHTATKEYVCDYCRELIESGQMYVRATNPAWLDYEADVDSEGRPVGYLRPEGERQWAVIRVHSGNCYWDYQGYND
jgi:hypothetical protein